MSKVLVIDDDVVLCELLNEVLREEGYDVHYAHCGESGLAYLKENPVDLVLLDVMLPQADGIEVARQICAEFATPIIMLTALNDEATLLGGLQAGADHFMPKPFRVPELLARITAMMRRVELERQRSGAGYSASVVIDQLLKLPLTGTECELLEYLVKHHGVVISKAELQQVVLKKELSPFDRNLDMHISNIRRKMVQSGFSKNHIKTVRGKGYSFLETVGHLA
ncbi:response regulator transcription factor [Photobacterium aphoticum]|uniref:Chemotaxis protein CheY n=2 Tax=Photobacterium aphoticum TaxID=754436 RepID=A0A0J1GJJ7_9GAMM|nr:response regulator transcription factor [Photobacterium aphoticum]KLU99854.1 chemotaxis protein CheY [Photobacterium aphoticum]PSU59457.1 DNA-binding response regulator [Photobacterium aphoticum]GHA40514.1 DNA-binding response regulator [Photobacterium aphoticum]